jgi:3',5'-cyclic-AMP phosphodiesterase
MKVGRLIIYGGLFMAFVSCALFEYSPNQQFDEDSPTDLNSQNLNKLLATTPDDTLTIAFIGDIQRFYDELEAFVIHVNSLPEVDLVIVAGDVSDFGLLQEFEWVYDRLRKLKVPYLAVVGNHDVINGKEDVFERFFGPLNFSFAYDQYTFLFHNTNSREYKTPIVPDLNWLSQALREATTSYIIGVSHVTPYNVDFNKDLEQPYHRLFASDPRVILSLHGHEHRHSDTFYYEDHVRYMVSQDMSDREFVLLKLVNQNIWKELVPF